MFFPTNFSDTETVRIASMHAVPPFPAWSFERSTKAWRSGWFCQELEAKRTSNGRMSNF